MDPDYFTKSADWAFGPGKILLGQYNGQLIGFMDDRHLVTVAGSRAGKGVSCIVPNLLTYEGSMMVLDPKGENATMTAERRGQGRGIPAGGLGHDVYVLDPFGCANVAEDMRAGFNPLADLDPTSKTFPDDCDSIADALVVAEPGKENDHWSSNARLVLRGFVAWVASRTDGGPRDLPEVYRLLHLPKPAKDAPRSPDLYLHDLLDEMMDAKGADGKLRAFGVPASAAGALLSIGPNEFGSVLSTVRANILFLSSPYMADMLRGTSRQLDLNTWKLGKKTVYLCLPAGRMHRHARFYRLFINRLLNAVEAGGELPKGIPRALMVLDEMHVLGHMAQLETAAGLFAGFGVKIWSIWQDFAQLESIYKERWETFIGNASIFQSFGLTDNRTLKYVSDGIGVSSVLQTSKSEMSTEQIAQGFTGESKSIQQVPLLTPDELAVHFSRGRKTVLVRYAGTSPMYLQRVEYYAHPDFKPMIEEQPNEQ